MQCDKCYRTVSRFSFYFCRGEIGALNGDPCIPHLKALAFTENSDKEQQHQAGSQQASKRRYGKYISDHSQATYQLLSGPLRQHLRNLFSRRRTLQYRLHPSYLGAQLEDKDQSQLETQEALSKEACSVCQLVFMASSLC